MHFDEAVEFEQVCDMLDVALAGGVEEVRIVVCSKLGAEVAGVKEVDQQSHRIRLVFREVELFHSTHARAFH